MAPRSIAIFLFLGVVSVNCQTWNRLPAWNSGTQNNNWNSFGNSNNALGGIWGNNNQPVERLTCIGKNNFKDEMRITITPDQNDNRMNNMWWLGANQMNQQGLNLESNIMIDPQSTTQGQYQFVITENGRVEDGCLNEYLGEVLDNQRPNMWFMANNRQSTRDGIVGQPFFLAPGNGQHWSGKISFRSMDDIVGRGCALCNSRNIVNGRCLYTIPLCCKFGFDSQSARVPINQNGMNQIGGMQTINIGQMNGMNGMNSGMNGMNTGMNGMNAGMNTGMNGGMNTGMGGGMNMGAGTNTAAGSNPMGLTFN